MTTPAPLPQPAVLHPGALAAEGRYPPAAWFMTRHGVWLHTRTVRSDDVARLLDLYANLSPQSRRLRFHSDPARLSEEAVRRGAAYFAAVDNRTMGGAIVAVDHRGGNETLVGIAQLGRNGPPASLDAEAAIAVRDDFHGQGVGSALLRRLGPLAAHMGIRVMVAVIDVENFAALTLFRGLGLPTTAYTSQGQTTLRITFPE